MTIKDIRRILNSDASKCSKRGPNTTIDNVVDKKQNIKENKIKNPNISIKNMSMNLLSDPIKKITFVINA